MDKLKTMAYEEAGKIRQFATEDEIARLNARTMHPSRISKCIYGQMTGDCYSKRASELLKKCCAIKYGDNNMNPMESKKQTTFTKNDFKLRESRSIGYYSALEVYLYTAWREDSLEDLINFIKDKK